MGRKTKVIGVRIDQEIDDRLSRFEAETGIERVTLTRNALIAALQFYEENHHITFPLRVIEGVGVAGSVRPDPETIAKLRPEDRGTPVLKEDSPDSAPATSPEL